MVEQSLPAAPTPHLNTIDLAERRKLSWRLTACGLALGVLAIAALSGPGRIDIVDGQTRYEVARSFVDHGDVAIRDTDVWFGVFPGRDGFNHTYYRFPQSALAVAAIWMADVTGDSTEVRRHFFFSLTGAVAAGALSLLYFVWFDRHGFDPARALAWAAAGIVCTPSFYYATTTFDDILGATAIVGAVVVADGARRGTKLADLSAGFLAGLAFNCKQPLAVFTLLAMAIADNPNEDVGRRLLRAGKIVVGLGAGVAAYVAFDMYKFPEGKDDHWELLLQYIPVWPGHPLTALLALALSPAAGILWYSPTVLLAWRGLRTAVSVERRVVLVLGLTIAIFGAFIVSMSIFKGDPAWGPRYFTPIFALLWLWAPKGTARLRRPIIGTVLALGLVVQVLALAVDPHRLYIERGLPSAFGAVAPLLYFDPANAHLVQRPREIFEVWGERADTGATFSPAPSPTFAFPIIDRVERGRAALQKYKVLNAFRPWWACHWYIPAAQRPVSIGAALFVFLMLGATAIGLIWTGLRMTVRS